MAVSKRLRTAGTQGTPLVLVDGTPDRRSNHGVPNMGTTDVRGNNQSTQVVTLGAFAGTDSFKIQVNYPHPEVDAEETVAFVRGTNCEAVAHLEAELEALNGISDVTVTGTTDAGPFTITFVTDVVMDNTGTTDRRYRGVGAQLALSDLSGCSGHVTVTDPSYVSSKGLPGEVHRHGTDTGVTTASFPGRHAADTIPLGHSAGAVGQVVGTDFVQLLPPAIDSAVGGNDTVAILGTEDASGNTVLYVICDADTGAVENVQTDADADVAATTLTAGEKFLVGYSLTTAGRVSKPSPREYFTVT